MVDQSQSASSDSSGGQRAEDDGGPPEAGASREGKPEDAAENTDPFGGAEGGPFEQRMSSEGESFQGPGGGDAGAGGRGSSAPGSASQDPFEEFASEFEDSGFGGGGDFDQPGPGSDAGFAYEMAKMWVRDNQKTVMVGAFAAGVFLGALLRD